MGTRLSSRFEEVVCNDISWWNENLQNICKWQKRPLQNLRQKDNHSSHACVLSDNTSTMIGSQLVSWIMELFQALNPSCCAPQPFLSPVSSRSYFIFYQLIDTSEYLC